MRKPPSPTTAMTALSGFTSLAAIADGRPAAQHTAASAGREEVAAAWDGVPSFKP